MTRNQTILPVAALGSNAVWQFIDILNVFMILGIRFLSKFVSFLQ